MQETIKVLTNSQCDYNDQKNKNSLGGGFISYQNVLSVWYSSLIPVVWKTTYANWSHVQLKSSQILETSTP